MCRRGALAVLVVVVIGPAAARAQTAGAEREIVGGIHGGLNASTWAGADDASIHLGALFGGFATVQLVDRLSVQAELVLSDKGADFEDGSGEKVKEALLYLELPVMARYDLPLGGPVSLHGLAGPGLAFLTDSKRTPRGDLRPVDLTLTAGAGADLATSSHRLSIEARFGVGLLDAVDDRARTARAMVVAILVGVTL